ncbi:MAG: hypothetical protein HWE39_12320 [Oceanospirillaceae bacterium]|nr:hypothetical protein [Oceanospirillaceae bacterium]
MYENPSIVLSPSIPPDIADRLRPLGSLGVMKYKVDAGARVYVCSENDLIDAAAINRLPDTLGLIAVAGMTTHYIALETARARGIKVSNIPKHSRDIATSLKANITAFFDRGIPLNPV